MRILLVEDDVLVQELMIKAFEDHALTVVPSGEEAIAELGEVPFNLLILDIKLNGKMTGVDVLERARKIDPLLPIVMATGLKDPQTMSQCLEMGAFDFVVKSHVTLDGYKYLIQKASVWRAKQIQNAVHKKHVTVPPQSIDEIIRGTSTKTRDLKSRISLLGKTEGPFLILGETGTGKELIAKALWMEMGDEDRPFITVNCAELQASTIEAELFGYEKGTFTGATSQRIGLFEAAHGGDIFLDEIGELPLEFQAKLLRVIQAKKVRRMGSTTERTLDFRIIAATNRDLRSEANAGEFRSDLLYRLDVHSIYNFPIRDRRDDIIPLVEHFLSTAGFSEARMEETARDQIINYDWPGNVRQLHGFITFLGPYLDRVDTHLRDDHWQLWISKESQGESSSPRSEDFILNLLNSGTFRYDDFSEETRTNCIKMALKISDNNRSQAARILGVNRQRLVNWISEGRLDA